MFNDMSDLIVSKRISEKCWLQKLKVCDVGSPPLPSPPGLGVVATAAMQEPLT